MTSVNINDSDVRIPESAHEEMLDAINEVLSEGRLNRPRHDMFHSVREALSCHLVVPVFEDDEEEGDIIAVEPHDTFNRDTLSLEKRPELYDVIAPYVTTGSWIRCCDDVGNIWQWEFGHGTVYRLDFEGKAMPSRKVDFE